MRQVGHARVPGEKGANLVEFALVMPLLLLLVLGIVEFSWLLARNLDVNQGAREGARMIAVNTPSGDGSLQDEICSRMDLVGSNTATIVSWAADDATPEVGEGVTVTVTSPTTPTLTGLLDFLFSGFANMSSSVEIRIEQPPDWTDGYSEACP
jgi:Flp pilus assembly protein TadG